MCSHNKFYVDILQSVYINIDLLANVVILDNTFELSRVLKELIEEGWSITRDEMAQLSPYRTHHVKRFGHYVMDLETLPQPLDEDLPIPV